MVAHPVSQRQPPNPLTSQQPGLGGLVEPRGAPPTSVGEREGNTARWLDFLVRPDVTAAMAQFGIQLLQPRPPGQTVGGQVGRALGGGLEAAGRVQAGQRDLDRAELERKLEEAKLKLEERRVRVGEAGVGTAQARTAIAGRQASTAERIAATGDRRLNEQVKQNKVAVDAAVAKLEREGKLPEAKLVINAFEAQVNVWEAQVRDLGVEAAGPPPNLENIQRQVQQMLGTTPKTADGSITAADIAASNIDPTRFEELARGLEAQGRPSDAAAVRAAITQGATVEAVEGGVPIAPAAAEPQVPTPAVPTAKRQSMQSIVRELPDRENVDLATEERIKTDPRVRTAAEKKYGRVFVDRIINPLEPEVEAEPSEQFLKARSETFQETERRKRLESVRGVQ